MSENEQELFIALRFLSLSGLIQKYPSSYFVNSSNLHPLRAGSELSSPGCRRTELQHSRCTLQSLSSDPTLHPDTAVLPSDHAPLTTAPHVASDQPAGAGGQPGSGLAIRRLGPGRGLRAHGVPAATPKP